MHNNEGEMIKRWKIKMWMIGGFLADNWLL